jgi:GT2 family glycosyltransferase
VRGKIVAKKIQTPLVSIIISNFNGKKYVENCLSSVLKTEYSNFEVVFVDNASTDGSLSIVEKSFGGDSRLRIVKNSKDLGFSVANNIGFKYTSGRYIAFLNNDTVVDSHWLSYLIAAFERDRTIGMAQTSVLEITGDRIQTNGVLLSDYYMSLYEIGQGKSIDTKYPLTFEVSFAFGAAMIIDRKIVEERGLFDPIVSSYYDDILLSIKTCLWGKRVVTVSESKIYHAGGNATNSNRTYYNTLFFEGKICVMFDIYYNFKDLSKALFVFAYSLLIELSFCILRNELSEVMPRVRALLWALKNFGSIWRNRNYHWNNARISPKTLIERFIRIRMPSMVFYLLPPSRWRKYCEYEAKKYENTLRQSCSNAPTSFC